MQRSPRTRLVWMASTVALLVGIAGCASADPADDYWADDYWVAEVERVRSQATSDFEREALADGRITRAEYEEATQRFVDCMNDRGVSTTREEQFATGVYQYAVSGSSDAVWDECEAGTTRIVADIYTSYLVDPEQRGPGVEAAECLQRQGLLPADYEMANAAEDHANLFSAYIDHSDIDLIETWMSCYANPRM